MAIGLATTKESGLVIYVLGFIAVITVVLGASVLVITWKDPSRLMLGEVTGREFTAIQTLRMGDNVSGERAERIIGPSPIEATPASGHRQKQLEESTTEGDEPNGDET